jgi:hypothetical protein
MQPEGDGAADWIPLTTAIARMVELAPVYGTLRGRARRDLSNAIDAGRMRLRGWRHGAETPEEFAYPIDRRIRLSLDHNTLSQWVGTVTWDTVMRDVEIEWKQAAQYLRQHVLSRNEPGLHGRPQGSPPSSARGSREQKATTGRPPEKSEIVRLFIEKQYRHGIPPDKSDKMLRNEINAATGRDVSEKTIGRVRRAIETKSQN